MHTDKINYELWEKHLPTTDEFLKLTLSQKLETLAWLAHLAPSSHNTQPWRFFCDENTFSITVALSKSSILPGSDVVGRQAVISIGCAIENIDTAARAYGLTTRFEFKTVDKGSLCPQGNPAIGAEIIAIVTLFFFNTTPTIEQQRILPFIMSRRTMRAEYDPTLQVPQSTLDKLTTSINDDLISIYLVKDIIRKLSISEFQSQADGYVLNSPLFSKELGNWLLPNDSDSPIGMPGNTFGLDDLQAERIHNGLLGKIPLEPEDMLRFSLGGKIGFEKSPVIAFLTTKNDNVKGWIATGRAMQRAFLILEQEGISYAVHAAIVEVRLVNRIFATTLGTLAPLAAVFRIGYVKDTVTKEGRPHSPRMPLKNILLKKAPN